MSKYCTPIFPPMKARTLEEVFSMYEELSKSYREYLLLGSSVTKVSEAGIEHVPHRDLWKDADEWDRDTESSGV